MVAEAGAVDMVLLRMPFLTPMLCGGGSGGGGGEGGGGRGGGGVGREAEKKTGPLPYTAYCKGPFSYQ